jgi:hypothetical protein
VRILKVMLSCPLTFGFKPRVPLDIIYNFVNILDRPVRDTEMVDMTEEEPVRVLPDGEVEINNKVPNEAKLYVQI